MKSLKLGERVSQTSARAGMPFLLVLVAALAQNLCAQSPPGTPENRPMRDTSKPDNGIEAGQKHLYPTADGGDKRKIHI